MWIHSTNMKIADTTASTPLLMAGSGIAPPCLYWRLSSSMSWESRKLQWNAYSQCHPYRLPTARIYIYIYIYFYLFKMGERDVYILYIKTSFVLEGCPRVTMLTTKHRYWGLFFVVITCHSLALSTPLEVSETIGVKNSKHCGFSVVGLAILRSCHLELDSSMAWTPHLFAFDTMGYSYHSAVFLNWCMFVLSNPVIN